MSRLLLRIQDVKIRKTHPGLYLSLMALGCGDIVLALNFWFSRPTFNPYDISKDIVGVVFFLLGASLIMFLNVIRELRLIRLNIAASITWMCFWGLSNTQQFLDGRASLQLPILYLIITVQTVPWLIESPVNPMTERE